jgi:hypothetical protein
VRRGHDGVSWRIMARRGGDDVTTAQRGGKRQACRLAPVATMGELLCLQPTVKAHASQPAVTQRLRRVPIILFSRVTQASAANSAVAPDDAEQTCMRVSDMYLCCS